MLPSPQARPAVYSSGCRDTTETAAYIPRVGASTTASLCKAASPVSLRASASGDVCVDGGLHRDEEIASGARGDDVCDRGATPVLGICLSLALRPQMDLEA